MHKRGWKDEQEAVMSKSVPTLLKRVLMLCIVDFLFCFNVFLINTYTTFFLSLFLKDYLSDNPRNLRSGMGQRENSFPFTSVPGLTARNGFFILSAFFQASYTFSKEKAIPFKGPTLSQSC